jgi:hypothetical protein
MLTGTFLGLGLGLGLGLEGTLRRPELSGSGQN